MHILKPFLSVASSILRWFIRATPKASLSCLITEKKD